MTTREHRMKIFPTSLKKTYEKSIRSKAFAIKAFCAECVGFERKAVRECTDTGCALWHHRPYQQKDDDDGEETDEEIDIDEGVAVPEGERLRGEDGAEP